MWGKILSTWNELIYLVFKIILWGKYYIISILKMKKLMPREVKEWAEGL